MANLIALVVADGGITGQPAVVGMVFLSVLLAGDTVWACCAASARGMFDRCARVRNRVTGGFLVAAGLGLAMARR